MRVAMSPTRRDEARAPRGAATALFNHPYRRHTMRIMNTKLKVVVLALGLGAATLAAAQSPGQAQTFANEVQQWQALAGTGTYTFHTPPTLGNKAQDPVGKESFSQRFADMQADSSNDSDMWQETQPT